MQAAQVPDRVALPYGRSYLVVPSLQFSPGGESMTPLQRAFSLEMRRALGNFHAHRRDHNRRFGFRPGLGKGCTKCERTSLRVIRNSITAGTIFGA